MPSSPSDDEAGKNCSLADWSACVESLYRDDHKNIQGAYKHGLNTTVIDRNYTDSDKHEIGEGEYSL
ncbi:MAG: hypothetical protein A2Z14_12760 [Chloroflexi bacterium RBG_16_48_8]|nr:MAG: hypothetical protein A2Z14_12760 [Chloroflexi bacterium RBG_16_48_8]